MKAWEPPKLMTTDEENYFTGQGLRKDPAPGLLALLKRCKTALQNALNDYALLNARNELLPPMEQVHPFTLGPAEIQSVLSDIAKAEEGR